ncbi:MAG: hypothetical protein OXR73_26635 [Myxococcales bacterium]|nr:hypothetical protein [Myxococcales bacterium]
MSSLARGDRLVAALAVASVLGLHTALVLGAFPWEVATRGRPVTGGDYDTHIGQTYRLIQSLEGWGQTWCYDVSLLAGHPANTIFDGDNKAWSLLAYWLNKAGLTRGQAFNVFPFVSALSVPLIVIAAGMLLGMPLGTAALAGGLASMLWNFDSFARWLWWVGMNAFAYGAVLLLLPLSMFVRMASRPTAPWAIATGIALGLCHLVHPFVFFVLAPAMGTLYAVHARAYSVAQHVFVAVVAAITLAINAPWILVALAHWDYILDSAFFVQGGLATLIADFLNILHDPTDTGVVGTRTGFRFLCLALAAVGLAHWRRSHDARFLPIAVTVGTGLFFAYLGRYVPLANQMQPYRHVLPAAFAATLPAAWTVVWASRQRPFSGLRMELRALYWIVVVGTCLHLWNDARYFFVGMLPDVKPLMEGDPSPLYAHGHVDALDFTLPHSPMVDGYGDRVAMWVGRHVASGERLLVEDIALGERLAWQALARRSGVEIVGGFRERNLVHAFANVFRPYQGRVIPEARMAEYLDTYAIDRIVAHHEHPEFARMPKTLERTHVIAGRTIYRNLRPHARVQRGGGHVAASMNRLEVRGSDPSEPVWLAYHYHPALRCKPDCQVQRRAIALDRAGLIAVPAPHPSDFVIYNGYSF